MIHNCTITKVRLKLKMTTQVEKAMLFAAKKHRFQRRKSDNSSYIIHPFDVYERLLNSGITDQDILIAGLLHDTIEDTDTTEEEILANFGPRITSIVAEVTDDKRLAKDERKRLQIKNAPGKSTEAKHVKLADKLSNLTGFFQPNGVPKGWTQKRVQGYIVWAWTVIAGMRGTNEVLEKELDELFKSELTVDGVSFVALPEKAKDMDTILQEYLQDMAKASD